MSDIRTQNPKFMESELYAFVNKGACSIVEQPPLEGCSISLLSYHMYCQTDNIFRRLNVAIEKHDTHLNRDTVRTWIYVDDIDNQYGGMVDARKEFFDRHGLTRDTRYIGSTGIEGKPAEKSAMVMVDSVSIGGLENGQLSAMETLDNLNPTIEYGVTFERGMKVEFGDRTWLHISGTASIDSKGEILYPGDVECQTLRTLNNIQSLLAPHKANLDDMAYLLVYIKNAEDYDTVREVLDQSVSEDVPRLYLHAGVCRPGWLVEIEGVAFTEGNPEFPVFM